MEVIRIDHINKYLDALKTLRDAYLEGDERHENADKHIWAIELMLKKLPTQEV